jgi:hypothetical protein
MKVGGHKWAFTARFRRHAFGWRSQPAIQRVKQAVSEIKMVARGDPALAADGAARTAELSRSRCRDHVESHLDLELSLDAHEQLYARAARGGLEVAAGG